MRHLTGLLAAVFVGAVNPSAGCGEDDFNFGEHEMSAFIVTKWTGELSMSASPATNLTLEIYRGTSSNNRLKSGPCGNRSFLMASAGACLTTTTMDFNATVDTDDQRYVRSSATGTFIVSGVNLSGGALIVVLSDGMTMDGIIASKKDGENLISAEGEVFDADRNVIGNFTLTRSIAP